MRLKHVQLSCLSGCRWLVRVDGSHYSLIGYGLRHIVRNGRVGARGIAGEW
jgi:hypothetical protein